MSQTTIRLGGIEFEDSAASGWSFDGLTDWWGQTDDKTDITERPQSHGAFPVKKSLRSSRAISFMAQFIGTDAAVTESALDTLASIGAEGPVEMIVATPAGSSSRNVTVEGCTVEDRHGRRFGTAAVELIAADPRRYAVAADVPWVQTGPPTSGQGVVWPLVWPLIWPGGGSSGRVTLTNAGTAPSAPEFRLQGGFSSALITCVETGSRIGLDRFVPAGSVVEINTAERRATIDGQSDVSRWLRWREWELVPPGQSRSFQFDVSGGEGSPILEGRVLHAWW